MRPLILAAALVAAPVSAQAPVQSQTAAVEPNPQSLPAARDLLAVMFPPAQREQIFESVMHAMMTNFIAGTRQGKNADPRVEAIVDKFTAAVESDGRKVLQDAMPGLFEAYARAYARHFSPDELGQIEVFAKTPAGSKFLQRSNFILSDPDVARWQTDIFSSQMKRTAPMAEKMQAEIAALKKSEGAKQ
ncbi:MAG: DUF2059 domain-containing protein [Pseudolabrys sp.]